jgi:F-type H+-transporting ATPase subunit delta
MKAATRYASSLIQLGIERNDLESIAADMAILGDTIDASHELVLFLKSPIINKTRKKDALNTIFKDKISTTSLSFLELLLKKGRENTIIDVVKMFKKLYNVHCGIIEIEVITASELDESQKNSLSQSLSIRTGKKVVLLTKIDKSVRGGIKARIDDTVIDGTVEYKLEQLRNTLLVKG